MVGALETNIEDFISEILANMLARECQNWTQLMNHLRIRHNSTVCYGLWDFFKCDKDRNVTMKSVRYRTLNKTVTHCTLNNGPIKRRVRRIDRLYHVIKNIYVML